MNIWQSVDASIRRLRAAEICLRVASLHAHSPLGTGGAIAMYPSGVISQLRPPAPTDHPTRAAELQAVGFQGGFQARHEKVVSSCY